MASGAFMPWEGKEAHRALARVLAVMIFYTQYMTLSLRVLQHCKTQAIEGRGNALLGLPRKTCQSQYSSIRQPLTTQESSSLLMLQA